MTDRTARRVFAVLTALVAAAALAKPTLLVLVGTVLAVVAAFEMALT